MLDERDISDRWQEMNLPTPEALDPFAMYR